jgi:hypothetical protein
LSKLFCILYYNIKIFISSPDPYLKKDADMTLVKFGHLNYLLDQANNNVFANNAAAIAGGLFAGDLYRTATGQLFIVYNP